QRRPSPRRVGTPCGAASRPERASTRGNRHRPEPDRSRPVPPRRPCSCPNRSRPYRPSPTNRHEEARTFHGPRNPTPSQPTALTFAVAVALRCPAYEGGQQGPRVAWVEGMALDVRRVELQGSTRTARDRGSGAAGFEQSP